MDKNFNRTIIEDINKLYESYGNFRLQSSLPWKEYIAALLPFNHRNVYLIAKDEIEAAELNDQFVYMNIVTLEEIGITEITSFSDFVQQFVSKFKKKEIGVAQPIIFSYDAVTFATYNEVQDLCKGFPYYIQEKPVNPVEEPPQTETFEINVLRRLEKLEAFYGIVNPTIPDVPRDIVEETRLYTYYDEKTPGIGY